MILPRIGTATTAPGVGWKQYRARRFGCIRNNTDGRRIAIAAPGAPHSGLPVARFHPHRFIEDMT